MSQADCDANLSTIDTTQLGESSSIDLSVNDLCTLTHSAGSPKRPRLIGSPIGLSSHDLKQSEGIAGPYSATADTTLATANGSRVRTDETPPMANEHDSEDTPPNSETQVRILISPWMATASY